MKENRKVFFLLKSVLTSLEEENDPSVLISYFEKELLRTLGFWREANLLETQNSKDVMERLLEKKLKTLRAFPLIAS